FLPNQEDRSRRSRSNSYRPVGHQTYLAGGRTGRKGPRDRGDSHSGRRPEAPSDALLRAGLTRPPRGDIHAMNPLTELQQTPTGGAGEDTDPAMGGAYRPLTEEVRQAARRAICARANDVDDARELLLALGLIPAQPVAPAL